MALTMSVTTDDGFTAPNAYIVITDRSVRADRAIIDVKVWKDQAAFTAGARSCQTKDLDRFGFDVDPTAVLSGVSLDDLAYGLLKSHPAFAGAVDA